METCCYIHRVTLVTFTRENRRNALGLLAVTNFIPFQHLLKYWVRLYIFLLTNDHDVTKISLSLNTNYQLWPMGTSLLRNKVSM